MLVPITPPPGVYRNGTAYQAKGRWIAANLVRWFEGTLRPIGGWVVLNESSPSITPLTVTGVPRTLMTWRAAATLNSWLAIGTHSNLYAFSDGAKEDITPGGLVAGTADSSITVGNYGAGLYGVLSYGTGDPAQGTLTECATWQLDTFGDYLVACLTSDGDLYYWDPAAGGDARRISNHPVNAAISDDGGVLTDETTDANDAGADDVVLIPATPQANDAFYLGLATPFAEVRINVGTAATDGAVTWEYWDGDSWEALSGVTDATTGFTVAGANTVIWTRPSDWATTTVNSQGPYYYVRARVTTAGTTTATGTQVWIGTGDGTAPDDCVGIVVTPERFVIALGVNGDPRTIAWPSQETLNTWAPSSTNSAGDLVLEGRGSIMCGRRAKSETLVWTDADLWAIRYIGGLLIYGRERVGSECGIISRNGVGLVDGVRAVWMGRGRFYLYDGYVRPLPCDVSDYVFGDFNLTQRHKVVASTRAQWGEVIWYYPSGGSTENDRYVVWNHRENHWATGMLERTCDADRVPFDYPIAGDADGSLYEHERGFVYGGLTPYVESGPMELNSGSHVMDATALVPDEQTLGDVTATLYTRLYPTTAERTYGPFTAANPTDVRITGRQVRVKLTQAEATDWRVGTLRLRVQPGSER